MTQSINRAVIVGNLTKDPDLRALPSGTSICTLRVAVNDRVKVADEWTDRANFFNVTVFGTQADNCAQFLKRGRQVAVEGKLRWSEWEKDGQKRSKVDIVADNVQFIGAKADQPTATEEDYDAPAF